MNLELYSRIKETIIEKDCLFQIDEDKKASIIHNISAYVAEMLVKEDCIEFASFTDFVTSSTYSLNDKFVADYLLNHGGRTCSEFYDDNKMKYTKLLKSEKSC